MKIFSDRVELQGSENNDPYFLEEVNDLLEEEFPFADSIEEAQSYVAQLEQLEQDGCLDDFPDGKVFENGMSWSFDHEYTYRGTEVVLTIGYSDDTGIIVEDNPLAEYDFPKEYYQERLFNELLRNIERGER